MTAMLRPPFLVSCLIVAATGSGCVVTTFEGPAEPSRAPGRPLPPGFEVPTGTATEDLDATDPVDTEIEVSHVLIMHRDSTRVPPGVTRSRAEAEELARKVQAAAATGKSFADLARQFSDEPGAGDRGGRLPPFRRGVMVPAFEDVAFRLEPGKVSDVVETDFGFHVIKRHR